MGIICWCARPLSWESSSCKSRSPLSPPHSSSPFLPASLSFTFPSSLSLLFSLTAPSLPLLGLSSSPSSLLPLPLLFLRSVLPLSPSMPRNVFQSGFSRPVLLPHSYSHDSVLCSLVADVDWDGRMELILGTYGKVGGREGLVFPGG